MSITFKLPPPPVQDDMDQFVWQDWFKTLREAVITSNDHGSLELLQTAASTTLPTTPTVLTFPTTNFISGFSYDSGTGIITINNSDTYTFTLLLNAVPSASNKNIYFYVEVDTGSGFAKRQYSGRQQQLVNSSTSQILIASSNYFAAGSKIKPYLWADATVTLQTNDLPGTSGTVSVPAARLLWA